MNLDEESLAFLRRPRERWVDITVEVSAVLEDGAVRVTSHHTSPDGRQVRSFSTSWPDPTVVNTEYGLGISLIHDVKDHTFYGLGVTNLTEFQTIVQTYYGREVSGGRAGRAQGGNHILRILAALKDELYGPRGPRVYGALETGLFDLHAPRSDAGAREAAFEHMTRICLDIMLPELKAAYEADPLLSRLQASTRDQPLLVESYLAPVRWHDEMARTMRLIDNTGLQLSARAYIDDELHAMTSGIRDDIRDYVARNEDELAAFRPIFDATDYVAAEIVPEGALR